MPMTSEEDVEDDARRLPGINLRLDAAAPGPIQDPANHNHNHSHGHNDGFNDSIEEEEDEDEDDDEDDNLQDDEDDEDGDEDDDDDFRPPPPFAQHPFAPPFYGRPPTPLPPSPSLTSLLRPSRPTTPDASDDDAAAAGASAGPPRPPVPRARPKVPTYEYYGFVLYLFSSLSFLIYLLWSYLPSPFLHALGIYYYPNRWWSLAIPSFLVMTLVYIYVALAGYNLEILTLPLESVETVVDEAAKVAVVDRRGRIIREDKDRFRRRVAGGAGAASGGGGGGGGGGNTSGGGGRRRRGTITSSAPKGREREGQGDRKGGKEDKEVEEEEEEEADGRPLHRRRGLEWKEVWNEGTDAVMDVPLAGVCEVLYGEGREWDSEVEAGGEGGITIVS
ncbi:hypothetical protein VTJ83DRAFT_601 [Remersonia thermophila]|uniref:PIG-P domain-containing protein n=1 Tax=Remersonia thermophila TaxID=72144 RepID=A0ABR4DMB1_9PEZI